MTNDTTADQRHVPVIAGAFCGTPLTFAPSDMLTPM
jgi:hypothetical protein